MTFSFIAYQPIDVTVDGEHIVMDAGDERPFTDACQAIRFINALTTATGGSVDDNTDQGLDQLQAACTAAGGGPGGTAPPTTPPPEPPTTDDPGATDPAHGDPDRAGGHDSETPQSLGAPEGNPVGEMQDTPRDQGASDGRPLASQFYDARDPMPDYDVFQQLWGAGLTGTELSEGMEAVRHNDPEPGMPHPWFGRGDAFPLTTVADPLLVFTGQYSLVVTDVSISSEPLPLHLTRTYTSGEVSFGPFGYNWDHNYNCYLRPLTSGAVAVWTGARHEDVYTPRDDGEFEPPTTVFLRLTHEPAGVAARERYVLTDREGMSQVFEQPPGWPVDARFPLVRLEDRHGRHQDVEYDGSGRVLRVRDQQNRFLHFSYGACGLLESVEDHGGRRWRYRHADEVEHLVAVTTPPAQDHPDGLTTSYEYDDWQAHPALVHNLIRVIDADRRPLIENTYGTDPMTGDFGRVVRQEFGPWTATFATEQLQYVPRTPDAVNVPAWRVSVVDPGVLRVFTFNYRGDLLDERFRLVDDGSYRLVARTYRYDEQGNLAERREPNGLGMAFAYDAANADPRARGNLLRAELRAPPARPAPSRIVQRLTYEPRFHRLKTLRDQAGRTTTWEYDYEKGSPGVGDVVAIIYPDATLPDGTAQPRREAFAYDTAGRLTTWTTGAGHRHTFAYAAAGSETGFLTTIVWDADGVGQRIDMEYDALGRRAAVVDGLGHRTETDFDALDRLVAVRRPGPATDEIRFGYTVDGHVARHDRPKGSFDDGATTDAFLRDIHEYDPWGSRTASTCGANTASPLRYAYQYDGDGRLTSMTDPLGTVTALAYDERGRVLTRTEAAGSPEEATHHYAYDLNGNQVRVEDPVGHQVRYTYDVRDRLVRVDLPGTPDSDRTSIALDLDELDHCRRLTITGLLRPGSTGTLFEARTDYDERGRPWRRRAGGLTSTVTYDADERARTVEDQRGGRLTLDWDGLNRVIATTDPAGNSERRAYDAAGSLVALTSDDNGPAGVETFTTTIGYDIRRRPDTLTSPLGQVQRIEYDARDLPVASVDPLGIRTERSYGLRGEVLSITAPPAPGAPAATTVLRYDVTGRLVEHVDGEGHITALAYDRRDRRTSITYPDSRVHRFSYGARRQVEREVTPGGTVRTYTFAPDAGPSRLDITPAPGVAATAPVSFAHDGLRRLARAEQDGHVLIRRYDMALRLVSEEVDGQTSGWRYDDTAGTARFTYPDGRVDRVDLDLLRRPVALTLQTPAGSGLTGGTPAGTVLARWVYAGPGRLIGQTLTGGMTTRLGYDAGRRVTSIVHKDVHGTELAAVRLAYDAADRRRVIWAAPSPLTPRRIDFDGLSRTVAVADRLALPPPPGDADQAQADAAITAAETAGAATEQYTLNAADVRTTRRTTSPAGLETYQHAAAWQLTAVTRTGPAAGTVTYEFDGDGRCTKDDRYRYVYDGLDRLVRVTDLSGAPVMTQATDPVGRPLSRTTASSTRELSFNAHRLIQWSENGAPSGQLSYGLGVDDLALVATGSLRCPLLDPAGSILAWADDSGAVLERYRYGAFGQVDIFAADGVTARPGATIDPGPAFGGHRLLVPGRYDARQRLYDPTTGQFTTPDPLGYPDAGNLYLYAHHNPVDLVDPTGEVALLLGLAVAAGVGLSLGMGTNAVRQGLQIHEGSRDSFSWGEMFLSGGIGAVAGPLLVVAPELTLPLAAYGIAGGIGEIRAGHYESGAFDIATSVLPFASKNVRGAAFGEGSVFAPAQGLGPIATPAARTARLGELGRATQDLAGRLWNERFYHGTTYYAALETVEQNTVNLTRVRDAHLTNPAPPAHGPGLYFCRQPGAPDVPGSPQDWAIAHAGYGQGGGPAILEASVPRWRLLLLRRRPGVLFDIPQQDFPVSPASQEVVFPLEGPRGTPPTGPGADFNAMARYRLWDPHAVAPSLDALYPALSSPVPWLRPPATTTNK
ncbi:RHS repeat-associated core domain-containing protein [Streptomyces sparsogenes]|uniref:RHS repeat-associated core domain-containing protein n=1 Tax=Streptomyces sparsogenes TaxID=67365 RepID=UPI00331A281E